MSTTRPRRIITLPIKIPGLLKIEEVQDEVRTLKDNIDFVFSSEEAARDFQITFERTESNREIGTAWIAGPCVQITLKEKEQEQFYAAPEYYKPQDIYLALHKIAAYSTNAQLIKYATTLQNQATIEQANATKKAEEREQVLARIPGYSFSEITQSYGMPALKMTFNKNEQATNAHYNTLLPEMNSDNSVFTSSLQKDTIILRTIPVEQHRINIDKPTTIDEVVNVLGQLYPAKASTVRVERHSEVKEEETNSMRTPFMLGEESSDTPAGEQPQKKKSIDWMRLFTYCLPGRQKQKVLDDELYENDHRP